MSMRDDLSGKVAVVTGGSSGIGAATARLLAGCGATVVVGYNAGAARAETLLAALPGAGHRTVHLPMGYSAAIDAAAAMVEAEYGRADIVVNAAGVTRRVPHVELDGIDDALIDLILTTNIRGPYAMIRAFAPLLRRTGGALVVNVSSVSAFSGKGSNVIYCASKAALDTMTAALARVLGPEIRLMCVSPGTVSTGFIPGITREDIEASARASPLRSEVLAEDVADAILACATHLRLATGARIVLDAGRHLG